MSSNYQLLPHREELLLMCLVQAPQCDQACHSSSSTPTALRYTATASTNLLFKVWLAAASSGQAYHVFQVDGVL